MQLKFIIPAFISFGTLALATPVSDLGKSIAAMTNMTAVFDSAVLNYYSKTDDFFTTYPKLINSVDNVNSKFQAISPFTEIEGKAIYVALQGFEKEIAKTMRDIIANKDQLYAGSFYKRYDVLDMPSKLQELDAHIDAFTPYWIGKTPNDLKAQVNTLREKILNEIRNTKKSWEAQT